MIEGWAGETMTQHGTAPQGLVRRGPGGCAEPMGQRPSERRHLAGSVRIPLPVPCPPSSSPQRSLWADTDLTKRGATHRNSARRPG